jgi:hypothetical protein
MSGFSERLMHNKLLNGWGKILLLNFQSFLPGESMLLLSSKTLWYWKNLNDGGHPKQHGCGITADARKRHKWANNLVLPLIQQVRRLHLKVLLLLDHVVQGGEETLEYSLIVLLPLSPDILHSSSLKTLPFYMSFEMIRAYAHWLRPGINPWPNPHSPTRCLAQSRV